MRKPKYLVIVESYSFGKTVIGFNSESEATARYENEKSSSEGYPISVRLLKRRV